MDLGGVCVFFFWSFLCMFYREFDWSSMCLVEGRSRENDYEYWVGRVRGREEE